MKWKLLTAIAAAGLVLPALGLAVLSALSRRPANVGVVNGHLAACPNSPNCVSTLADDWEHHLEPLAFNGAAHDALETLKTIVGKLPRTKVVTESDNYLHVEFTSALFRFVDDVEFLVDTENRQVHFRSASRVGHGDLGANRRRMEAIERAFR